MDTYKYELMAALLDQLETINKDKHRKHCHGQRKQFSLFVLSVDGMLGREDLVVLTQPSRIMAAKMDKTISHLQGWINNRIAIAVARLYSRMNRGA